MLDLDTLNSKQREAVETTDGAVLVLAGAGSGKTRVLTYRIAYILLTGLAGPDNILAMTFTNKAAKEMKERAVALMSQNSQANIYSFGWMGTFHSICVKLLKIYGKEIGIDSSFTIYDTSDTELVLKEAMAKANISTKDVNPKAIKNYISSAKNELVGPEEYLEMSQGYFQNIVAKVYPIYQKILRENNALDFDDLIMKTLQLLKSNQKVRELVQDKFRYILVDEYQDTNHAQYELVNMFAAKHKNICCVGDDDQSIYSFRGATIKNILTFEHDYPDTKIIKLEQNYRSTKKILSAAHQVIAKNSKRREKELWTDNSDGDLIVLFKAEDQREESSWVVSKIMELKKNTSLGEIAILYRTNAQSRNLEEAFLKSAIPYRIIGGLRFYERKEIKDILAYLKALHNTSDSKSFERIVNFPRRNIGPKTYVDLKNASADLGMSTMQLILDKTIPLPNAKFSSVRTLFCDLYENSKKMQVVDFIHYLLDKIKYLEILDDGTTDGASRIENIKELVSVATKYAEFPSLEGLPAFLDEVSLLEEDGTKSAEVEAVTLMTVHAAKGLEFEHVFVVGMEESLFPHASSLSDSEAVEEERRLAYVAITRAKINLYITYTDSRLYFGSIQNNSPSRFLQDISPDLLDKVYGSVSRSVETYDSEWNDVPAMEDIGGAEYVQVGVGARVKHPYFGIGKVVFVDGEVVRVDFGSMYGQKELMLEYAQLEIV